MDSGLEVPGMTLHIDACVYRSSHKKDAYLSAVICDVAMILPLIFGHRAPAASPLRKRKIDVSEPRTRRSLILSMIVIQ